MITICTTTLQAAAGLQAAGLVDQLFDLGCYEDGQPRCLVSLSRPISTKLLQEVTMSHKTKAAMTVAARSCALYCANLYGDSSTISQELQGEISTNLQES